MLKTNDVLVDDPVISKDHVISFCKELYNGNTTEKRDFSVINSVIRRLVSDEDIVKQEVLSAVEDFFFTGHVSNNLNFDLSLIPKIKGALSIEAFRPIVLGNFLFKIITKIVADRLGLIASSIFSGNQFAFNLTRQIQDCITLASEGLNALDKKCFGGNMALYIDIKKAFETL